MKDFMPPSRTADPDINGERAARRKLLWVCGLMVSLAAVGSVWLLQDTQASRVPTTTRSLATAPIQRAVQAVSAGELTRARDELSAALADDPHQAPALLVLACIELEENNLPEAHEVISRLRSLAPERPEPRLLESLLAHRQRALSSGWGQAFLDAWNEVGRPDLQQSPLLPAGDSISAEDRDAEEAAWRRAGSVPVRLTLALASPELSEDQARWLMQQVATMEEPALLAATSEVLSHKSLPAALRKEALPLLRQRLDWLAEVSPRSMQPRLQLLLVGTAVDSSLTPIELDALEVLSLLPVWKETSYPRTLQEARERLREAGIPTPGARAFLVAERTTGSSSALLLLRRAKATREKLSEDERRWMGRTLWRIGNRLSENSSYLEYTLGLLLMESGAEDLNDRCGQSESYTRQDELSASVVASYKAAFDRWPLPSLHRELEEARARDEVTWLRFWLGKSALP